MPQTRRYPRLHCCVRGFLQAWVSCYGVPVTVVTDKGGQFTGDLWSTMCTKLSIHHRTTSSFHPKANGLIERMHRTLKQSLRAKCQSSTWSAELPLILLRIRSAPHETDSILSFEQVFRVPPILSVDNWVPQKPPTQLSLRTFRGQSAQH